LSQATSDPAPAAKPRPQTGPSWRWLVVGLAGGVVIALGVVLTIAALDSEQSRQDVVAERGAVVMPFDLDATTHSFQPTDFGGIQTVVADVPTDADQIALVRAHLQAEAERFARGDFGDPATIHGSDMAGLAVLEASGGSLTVAYRDVPGGGEIAYRTTEPAVVQALHDWFAAQRMDHGDHAQQP
jgi:hypothetical protein